jgi:hypothetical protein
VAVQLPMQWNTTTAAGSLWVQTFTFLNADGTRTDLTGLSWEFVIRPGVTDSTSPPLVKVTTTAGVQGGIVVDIDAATVTVTLTPAATTALANGARRHALWSQPGTADATCWVAGTFNSVLVAAA